MLDSYGHLQLYYQYINKHEKIVLEAEVTNLIVKAGRLCQNYDLPSVIKSFPILFKEKNRELSFTLLKQYLNNDEPINDFFHKEIALYFDILLELGGYKGLKDDLIKDKLNFYQNFYVNKHEENTELKDYDSVVEKIGSIFNPFKKLAEAILNKEIEIIVKAFENTVVRKKNNHFIVQDSVIVSRLEKESIDNIKNANQDLFHLIRKPLLKNYLIERFTLPEEKKEEYKFDDQLDLEISPSKCKLFEILLQTIGDEERIWVEIKIKQINNYFKKEKINLENFCDGCTLLKKELEKYK